MRPLPHATRNQVFTALFQFVQTLPPPGKSNWVLFSQWLRSWDEIDAAQQPAIFLHRGPQAAESKHVFGVTKWQWRCSVWIYYRTDGYKSKNTYPDQLTDPFLDSVEQLFQTDALDNRQTLGGLVYHVWIDGSIYFDSGLVDGQAVVVVPLSILL